MGFDVPEQISSSRNFNRDLRNEEDEGPAYGTGRIFVQGPSEDDVALAISLASCSNAQELQQKRVKEEGSQEAVVQMNEWAVIDEESDVGALTGYEICRR